MVAVTKPYWLMSSYTTGTSHGTPHPYDFLAGARGVQLAELGLASSAEGRRFEVPEVRA